VRPPPDTWALSPAWRLESLGDHLLAQAGADEVYVIDEAAAADHARLISLCEGGEAASWAQDAHLGAALRQLRRLGVLVPQGAAHAFAAHARLVWLGTPCEALGDGLVSLGWQVSPAEAPAPLTLLVRTNASWSALMAAYGAWHGRGPHLLVDLSHHHTLSVGPLVVPGQTACVACLGHRIVQRWGDLLPPTEPAMLRRAAGVAALLSDVVRLGPELVERVAALDLRHLRLSRHRVHMQPGCPVCQASREDTAIELASPFNLPWVD
jgi:hypothetical protein